MFNYVIDTQLHEMSQNKLPRENKTEIEFASINICTLYCVHVHHSQKRKKRSNKTHNVTDGKHNRCWSSEFHRAWFHLNVLISFRFFSFYFRSDKKSELMSICYFMDILHLSSSSVFLFLSGDFNYRLNKLKNSHRFGFYSFVESNA